MRIRELAVTAVAIGAVSAAPASPAAAAREAVNCGAEISQDVKLTRDLACSGIGLKVVADGVTVDLNGHTIRYVGAADEWGVAAIVTMGVPVPEGGSGMVNDVEVRNGVIKGYGTSLHLELVQGADVSRVRMDGLVRLFHSGHFAVRNSRLGGLIAGEGAGDLSRTSQVERNRIGGEVHLFESSNIKVARNEIRPGADQSGIAAHYSSRLELVGNRIRGGTQGILLSLSGSVTAADNKIQGSGVGARVQFSGDVTVRNNHILRSRAEGIIGETEEWAPRIRLASNRVTASGADGISIRNQEQASHFTLAKNQVRASRGHGIDATGALDGGGNRASGNRLSPQCIGVRCK